MRESLVVRVSVALAIVAASQMVVARAREASAAKMATAAEAFLASLGPDLRSQAVFAYASDERLRWHFIPNETFPRKGVAFRVMNEAQKAAAHALLKTGLSQQGYATATAIIQLEDVLRAIERSQRMARSPLDYQFTIFGTPGARGQWGWRVEGHHLSLHFSVRDGRVVASSPTFTGANPADVPDGRQKGQRVLAPLEDAGRALIEALSVEQRAAAMLEGAAPSDIVTANKNDISPLTPAGLPASRMTAPQREQLMRLVTNYTQLMAEDVAADRMRRLSDGGLDRVTFAWAGPVTKGDKHYYRVQGPTFLIEYDNTQNNGNHIHAVWRDFQGDFGRDVLREHVLADHVR